MPARLRIGIEMRLPPELNSPMYATVDASRAALRAFERVRPTVHAPAREVALLSATNFTGLPASHSAWRAPALTALVCSLDAPLSGRLEYTVGFWADALAGNAAAIRMPVMIRFMVRRLV